MCGGLRFAVFSFLKKMKSGVVRCPVFELAPSSSFDPTKSMVLMRA